MADISPDFFAALRAALPGLDEPPAVCQRWPVPRARQLASGRVLFAQGARVKQFYLLGQGELSLDIVSSDGSGSSLGRLVAPGLFGLSAFVTGRPSRFEARAAAASEVWPLALPLYTALMDEWPGFARLLLQRFAEHFDGNLGLLGSARHAALGDRVWLAVQQLPAKPAHDGWRELRITQAELARLAGVSRQGVNAWLRERQAGGEIEQGYGWLRWRA